MLLNEDFGVEKAIVLSGDGFGIDVVCLTRWSLVRSTMSGYKHGAGNVAKLVNPQCEGCVYLLTWRACHSSGG